MSDSSCSNCDDDSCPFRDYSYNCFKQEIADIQQCMDKADIELFQKIVDRADILYKQTRNDSFYQMSLFGRQVINCFNGE